MHEDDVSTGPLEPRHRASRRRPGAPQVAKWEYPWLEGCLHPLQARAISRALERMSKLEPCGDVGGVGGVLLTHFLRSPYQNWKGMLNVHLGISLGQQANRAYCRPGPPLPTFLTSVLGVCRGGVCGSITFIQVTVIDFPQSGKFDQTAFPSRP